MCVVFWGQLRVKPVHQVLSFYQKKKKILTTPKNILLTSQCFLSAVQHPPVSFLSLSFLDFALLSRCRCALRQMRAMSSWCSWYPTRSTPSMFTLCMAKTSANLWTEKESHVRKTEELMLIKWFTYIYWVVKLFWRQIMWLVSERAKLNLSLKGNIFFTRWKK